MLAKTEHSSNHTLVVRDKVAWQNLVNRVRLVLMPYPCDAMPAFSASYDYLNRWDKTQFPPWPKPQIHGITRRESSQIELNSYEVLQLPFLAEILPIVNSTMPSL